MNVYRVTCWDGLPETDDRPALFWFGTKAEAEQYARAVIGKPLLPDGPEWPVWCVHVDRLELADLPARQLVLAILQHPAERGSRNLPEWIGAVGHVSTHGAGNPPGRQPAGTPLVRKPAVRP